MSLPKSKANVFVIWFYQNESWCAIVQRCLLCKKVFGLRLNSTASSGFSKQNQLCIQYFLNFKSQCFLYRGFCERTGKLTFKTELFSALT